MSAAKIVSLPVTMSLRQIRAGSCYGALRGIVNLGFAFAFAGSLVGVGIALQAFGPTGWPALCAIAGGIVVVIAMIAIRQALLLLVDIADTLIASHARGF